MRLQCCYKQILQCRMSSKWYVFKKKHLHGHMLYCIKNMSVIMHYNIHVYNVIKSFAAGLQCAMHVNEHLYMPIPDIIIFYILIIITETWLLD